ncbi:MAG: ribosomal protein S18-alanine N-acetyltransferase [Gemmatimonadetes bacterium]|nr:ribosomal protein S18-alanine N-acetyltransferase [Gemmatimonadota bacterium]
MPFFVAADASELAVGYVVAHYGADEAEILNLGVAPEHRRCGVGKALVEQMLATLAAKGVRSVYLEVRESNAAARRLYEQLGFTPVGLRPNYYRRPPEAAVVLRTAILAVGGDA